MSKEYLKSGQRIFLNGGGTRVGATGTCVDTIIDWKQTQEDNGRDGVADVFIDEIYYQIYIDDDSGRFWFDNEKGS